MKLFLGIDFGTSGIRTAVIDEIERLVSFCSVSMPSPEIGDGNPRQNPQIWWNACVECLQLQKEKLAKSQISMSEIVALSVDGTSGTLLLTDEMLNPTTPGLMYNSSKFEIESVLIEKKAPQNSIVRGKSSALARLLYLQKISTQKPVYCFSQADWILAKLMQKGKNSDENNMLKLGYDLLQESWPDWFADCGVNLRILPQVHRVGRPIGKIFGKIAKKLGLSSSLECYSGTTDSNAAFLASGASVIGDGVTSLGTTLSIKLITDRPVSDLTSGVYSHRIGTMWLAGGASNTGGGVLLKYFDRHRMNFLTSQLNPENLTELDYYPLVVPGERFPINDASLSPRLTPRPADDVKFFQAMLEGIASIEKLGYKSLEKLGSAKVQRIFTAGGGAQNQPWQKIREKIQGVPIVKANYEEAAIGSAILATGKYAPPF